MKKSLPFICIAFALLAVACKKNTSKTNEVFIRIENATTEKFSSFALNSTEFGGINSGDTSSYALCKNVLPIPFSNLITINDKVIYIVDIVPTPYMDNGNYRMKVVSDTTSFRYKASFIKE